MGYNEYEFSIQKKGSSMIFKITPCTCELLDPKIENGGYTRSGDTLLASLRSVGGFAAVFFMVLHV